MPTEIRDLPPLELSVDQLLDNRGKTYGKFIKVSETSQQLKRELYQATAMRSMTPDQAEALDMICSKLARIVNGDPNYADSWIDIAGYAQLVADRLNGVER